MEIQLICVSVQGNMRQQAMLAFLVEGIPGKTNNLLSNFNVMRVPSMDLREVDDFIMSDFNFITIMFDKKKLDPTPPPFNYYKYMGSMTTPPCEEYVVVFVGAVPIQVSTTIISQLREGLNYPDENTTPENERISTDGSNRLIQEQGKREVMYFDREKSCTPYKEKFVGEDGHWEKLDKAVDRYFYVSG